MTTPRLVTMALYALLPCLANDQKRPELDFFLTQEVFPHVAVGGPWSTTLTFVNVGQENATFNLRFFTPEGRPWVVTTSEGQSFSNFAVTVLVLSSLDVTLPSRSSAIQTGWAEIDQPSNTTVGGHAIFRDNGGPGRPIPFEAVVPLSTFAEGSTGFIEGFRTTMIPFDQTQGFNTCIALANASQFSSTSVALVTILNGEARTLGDDITLAPRSQTSLCFGDRFPELANRKGVVVIARTVANLHLSVLAFRVDPQGSFTTFFPMSEL